MVARRDRLSLCSFDNLWSKKKKKKNELKVNLFILEYCCTGYIEPE